MKIFFKKLGFKFGLVFFWSCQHQFEDLKIKFDKKDNSLEKPLIRRSRIMNYKNNKRKILIEAYLNKRYDIEGFDRINFEFLFNYLDKLINNNSSNKMIQGELDFFKKNTILMLNLFKELEDKVEENIYNLPKENLITIIENYIPRNIAILVSDFHGDFFIFSLEYKGHKFSLGRIARFNNLHSIANCIFHYEYKYYNFCDDYYFLKNKNYVQRNLLSYKNLIAKKKEETRYIKFVNKHSAKKSFLLCSSCLCGIGGVSSIMCLASPLYIEIGSILGFCGFCCMGLYCKQKYKCTNFNFFNLNKYICDSDYLLIKQKNIFNL